MLANRFDHVFVINLQRQPQRLEKLLARLPDDWPFPTPRPFTAVDASLAPAPDWWQAGDGAWGCFQSHQRLIEHALVAELPSLLVLEDDAIFCDDFARRATDFMNALPSDWDYVYLGGQRIQRGRGVASNQFTSFASFDALPIILFGTRFLSSLQYQGVICMFMHMLQYKTRFFLAMMSKSEVTFND